MSFNYYRHQSRKDKWAMRSVTHRTLERTAEKTLDRTTASIFFFDLRHFADFYPSLIFYKLHIQSCCCLGQKPSSRKDRINR